MRLRNASLAAVLLALVGVGLSADTSQTYGPLASSAQFQMRVAFALAQQSAVVLTEAQTAVSPNPYNAPCHSLRTALAAQVARNPQSYAPIFAQHLAAHVNITTAGALTGTLTAGTLDSPANDAVVLSAVANVWNPVSGCISNP
jgi:hypothetical protein